MRKITIAVALLGLCSSMGNAQTGTTTGSPPSDGTSSAEQAAMNLPAELKQKLEAAGYKDIKVVPRSFLIEAKDMNNNDVKMVINPNSILAVVEPSQPTTTGSGSSTSPRQPQMGTETPSSSGPAR